MYMFVMYVNYKIWYQYPILHFSLLCLYIGDGVVVLVVTACREPASTVSWHHQKVSCPLENIYVSHFVLPFDLRD